MRRRRVHVALVGLGVALVVAAASPGGVAPSPAGAQGGFAPLLGGGSSFAALEIDQWRADTAGPPLNLRIDYQAAGSTFGRLNYLNGKLDFGATDIPFQDSEAGQLSGSPRRSFVYVPVSAGGLGFMYNVPGRDGRRINNLRLSQRNVCRAFTEPQIYWDDPAIVAENPGVPLPHERIQPVVRSDGSGTSYVFSEFCIATAPDVWGRYINLVKQARYDASSEFLGGRPTSNWPACCGAVTAAFAADGVANAVANSVTGKYKITYNEAGFALVRRFPNASIRNGAGIYRQPEAKAVTVALAYARGRPNGTFILEYLKPDRDAYFPSSYSYILAQTQGFDRRKGQTLATFLNYSVTAGQQKAERLGYARLSTTLVNLALDQIQKIPGAPPRPTNLAGAPPPPRPIDLGGAGGGGPAGGGGDGPAAGPGAPAGGTSAAAQAGAAAAAAGAAAGEVADPAAGVEVTENEDGRLQLDLDTVDDELAAAPLDIGDADPISDKEALWMFLIGMGIAALGTAAGTRALGRSRSGA